MGSLDDRQIAPDQDLRDCCIKCGALGDWCYDSDIDVDADGNETRVNFYTCDVCGKSWAEDA